MLIFPLEFEWDEDKERTNLKKHEFNFSDAISAMHDPHGLWFDDKLHSFQEPRFFWIGKCSTGAILTVWYTMRGNRVRVIGCAELRKFKRIYYETTQAK